MRKQSKVFITTVVCGFVLASCGGGGGGGKSGLKKNDHLGMLPAMYADYYLAKKAHNEKVDKLLESGDFNKMEKEGAKLEKEANERDEKFQADTKAEFEKLSGKDVPFSCSEAFANDWYEVASVKFAGELCIEVLCKAKEDFEVNKANKYDYEYAYFRVYAKDGSTITKGTYMLVSMGWNKNTTFTKGQIVREPYAQYFFPDKQPEKWVDFAGIEFITKEEYEKN